MPRTIEPKRLENHLAQKHQEGKEAKSLLHFHKVPDQAVYFLVPHGPRWMLESLAKNINDGKNKGGTGRKIGR